MVPWPARCRQDDTNATTEHIRRSLSTGSEADVAFFYCQYGYEDEHSVPLILGSFLAQLYGKDTENVLISDEVRNAYKHSRTLSPTLDQLQIWLSTALSGSRRNFLILDGVDEYSQHHRDDLFGALFSALSSTTSLLVTSRNLPDIGDALQYPITLHIQALDDDVNPYVTRELDHSKNRRFKNLIEGKHSKKTANLSLREEIKQQVLRAAGGM